MVSVHPIAEVETGLVITWCGVELLNQLTVYHGLSIVYFIQIWIYFLVWTVFYDYALSFTGCLIVILFIFEFFNVSFTYVLFAQCHYLPGCFSSFMVDVFYANYFLSGSYILHFTIYSRIFFDTGIRSGEVCYFEIFFEVLTLAYYIQIISKTKSQKKVLALSYQFNL